MSAASATVAPPTAKTLRRLFLTLFLRGRSSRGLRKESAPKSVGSKLALTLFFYAAFGLVALMFLGQPVFSLALYLHAMTLVFLGMFVAASAGEVLFNKEEADILMHRPVTAGSLLWAKIGVLVQVSLWLAGAFNIAGLFVGIGVADGGWLFPVAHALSTVLEALFCTSSVVITYQLCLRWFGRERLDGLMTTAQVFVAVAAVLGGQLVPQLMFRIHGTLHFTAATWWVCLLPPAWFAGMDDAIAGARSASSWELAAFGLAATGTVLWLAFGKLARDYEIGLQTLNEAAPTRRRQPGKRRWIDVIVNLPPLSWWLRDSVARASYLLTAAYLLRDRDVKLRIYPGLAPFLVMPIIFLLQGRGTGSGFGGSGFGIAFSGCYMGLVPMFALNLLQYSQQWQAADLFRAAPMRGPAQLCHGARRAVLSLLALPVLALMALIAWLLDGGTSHLLLLLPGVIGLPVYALAPCLGGGWVPLSMPTEEAKSANRGLSMIGVMMVSMAVSGIAFWAWSSGWFGWFLLAETILAIAIYVGMRAAIANVPWRSME